MLYRSRFQYAPIGLVQLTIRFSNDNKRGSNIDAKASPLDHHMMGLSDTVG